MAEINLERELERREQKSRVLVTIRNFRDPSEAMIAKAMLNSAGIECFLVDENTGRMLGFIPNSIGVRLQVHEVDAKATEELLEPSISEDAEAGDTQNDGRSHCPMCNSLEITFQESDAPVVNTGAWLSVHPPLREKVWECKSCGYIWDEEEKH